VAPGCSRRRPPEDTGAKSAWNSYPLGDPLGLQVAIPRKQLSAFEAIPALVASLIVTLRILDDCSHSYLLTPHATVMVKIHGEG
jgi:hypothetical protein